MGGIPYIVGVPDINAQMLCSSSGRQGGQNEIWRVGENLGKRSRRAPAVKEGPRPESRWDWGGKGSSSEGGGDPGRGMGVCSCRLRLRYLATEGVGGRVNTWRRVRSRGWIGTVEKEVVESDRVAQIDTSVVVDVGSVEAAGPGTDADRQRGGV